jgi:hypothetical protein
MPKGQYNRNRTAVASDEDLIKDLKGQIETLKSENAELLKLVGERKPIDPAAMLVGLACYFQLKATRDRLSPPPLIVTNISNGGSHFMAQPNRQTFEINVQTAFDCFGEKRGPVMTETYTMEQFESLMI